MTSKGVPFYAQTTLLDRIIHAENPASDPEMVNFTLGILRTRGDLRSYFFRSKPSLAWAKILSENGFFVSAPIPAQTDQGNSLPPWDAQYYLLSIAPQVPEIVIKHIMEITGHGWYLERAIEALWKIPLIQAERVLPIVLEWLRDPEKREFLFHEAVLFLNELVKAERWKSALSLFSVLSSPSPKRVESSTDRFSDSRPLRDELFGTYSEPAPGFSILKKRQTEAVVRILEKHLKIYLRSSGIRSWWRSAIESTDQDTLDTYQDLILCALRDTLDEQVEIEKLKVEQRIQKYLRSRYEIFCRLALYLLWIHGEEFISLAKSELLKRENIDNTRTHHEYFMLLEHCFILLASSEKNELLAMFFAGPNERDVRRLAAWAEKEHNIDKDIYISNYKKLWIRNRLWMIRSNLDKKSSQVLTELVAGLGEPDHPSFLSWSTGGFVKDVSPFPPEQLSNLSPDELYQVISEWQPTPERGLELERVSYAGFADEIVKLVLSNPEKYAPRLPDISLLRPEYASAIFGHWSNKEYTGEIPWQVALGLCEKLLESSIIWQGQAKEIAGYSWTGVRLSMTWLIERGLSNENYLILKRLLPKTRDILLKLITDPDPTVEEDRPPEGWMGHNDPITLGLNHVRPRAVSCLIKYAVRKSKVDRKQYSKPELETSVQEALTNRVNPQIDNSRAVHSVIGQCLPQLFWLDRIWLTQYLDDIFPLAEDEETKWLFISAWEGYVVLNHYNPSIFEMLRPRFEQMIRYLAEGLRSYSYLNATGHFAIHIALQYVLSDVAQQVPSTPPSLAVSFVQSTSPEVRKNFGWALWLVCKDNPTKIGQFWPKAKSFWEWRTREAIISSHSPDYGPELGEYSQLLQVAPKSETIRTLRPLLEGLLPYMRGPEFRNQMWNSIEKFLAGQVEEYPIESIQYYRAMYEQKDNPPRWLFHSDEAKKIIEVSAKNPGSRRDTLSLIDLLARWGDYTFRDLYSRYI
jgi:hypothetical protein